jgi:PPOX class probable FMN-dependent enzyme
MTDICDPIYDNRFTQAFGFPLERIQTKVKDFLPDPIKAFIAQSPFAVMATSGPDGRCDASPKGGAPGFVRILDDRHLLVPDVAGNKLFQGYTNMDRNPHVGLLFFIPGLAEVVRVNGTVRIVDKDELERHDVEESMSHPDGNRDVLQGIVVQVQEAYGHCPRAINYSDLWNTAAIEERRASGTHPLRPAAASATPAR